MTKTVETKITVVEQEHTKASAREDLKKRDPDETTAAALIDKYTKNNASKEGGAANENPKKHD